MNQQDYEAIRSNQWIVTKGRGYANHGEHVGRVERLVGGEFIQIKRQDTPDFLPHWFPVSWIEEVEDGVVYLDHTLEEYERGLLDRDPTKLVKTG